MKTFKPIFTATVDIATAGLVNTGQLKKSKVGAVISLADVIRSELVQIEHEEERNWWWWL